MKKFEGVLICTDLDGTLLKNDKSISKENLEAIEYFKENGGIFTFVTGRMPFFVADIYNAISPNAPFGCINGGGIFDHRTQSYVWTRELSKDALELTELVANEIPEIGVQINTFERIYFRQENEAMVNFRRITGVPNITCHCDEVNEPIAKIVFGDLNEKHLLRAMKLLHAHPLASAFDFVRSEYTLYEILPKGVNKGNILPRLAQMLHVSPRRVIGVGDYHNDIEMLRTAALGVAVQNAQPQVKAVADHITVSNEEHAIAKIIEELDAGILQI